MNRLIQFAVLIMLLSGCSKSSEPAKSEVEAKTFNVMAPLHLQVLNDPLILEDEDFELFEDQLKMAKEMGVNGVSVDVWWGDVEGAADNQFDWEYYHKIFNLIISQNLQVIPILAFHQCGGNVGDDYTSLLPSWVWSKLKNENPDINDIEDLKYISSRLDSTGKHPVSNEFVALWADEMVKSQYIEFMEAFKSEFANDFQYMQEINISCGPSGELRYPSYNPHDNWSYPGSGYLQCYSDLALADFQQHCQNKYGTIAIMNQAWQTDYNAFDEINFPVDTEVFFSSGDYRNKKSGTDFLTWYNQSMINHGRRMTKWALSVFEDDLSDKLKLGIKMPGIHWQLAHPTTPRITEIKCGLIDSNFLFGSRGYYQTLNSLFKDLPLDKVNLHFTCLEMGNEYDGTGESTHYSRAKELVNQIDSATRVLNIAVKGENALAVTLYNQFGWDNIRNALDSGNYQGITILRIGDVTTDNDLGKVQFSKLIGNSSP